MRPDRRAFLTASGAVLAGLHVLRAAAEPRGLVVGQAEGAEAGNAVLAGGGNAADAIVTAALVAGVVALPSTGIGGYGGHAVVAKPDGKVSAIDFNGTAPAAAKPDLFGADERGAVRNRVNAYGWLASGVPGVLAGLQLALDRFGTKGFAEAAKPAIEYAREGVPLKKNVAAAIKAHAARLAKDAGSAKLYFTAGRPLAEGETFRNPDLAAMLQKLADRGRVDAFYTGDVADAVAAAFKKNGGLVTAADLAAFKPHEVTPLVLEWQGHAVHTPPPTAGGLTVLQALAALKALGWEKWDAKDPATVQARVEALRLAWDDRLELLGDPKHADVPVEKLLSEKHAKESADRVRAALKAGKPVEARGGGRPAGGTIHLNAVDQSGLAVALTFTHGDAFGAQVTVDGLGLTLGHGMSRFDPRAGRANSVGPGKRPLHNMCPAVVAKGGRPVLALGATGGRRIPNTVFDVLAYHLGERRDVADAVKAPRVHTEGDLALALEAAWPAPVADHFRTRGYDVKTGPGATLSAIARDPVTGALRAASR
ncbi:MAG TPA: gamma-glutamyltransferase [Gemmataceae bacterium]|nr:gamma-glutamyltransferase [Gemmataceae bacterium]